MMFREMKYFSPNRGNDTGGDNTSADETVETQRPSITEYFEKAADYYERKGMDYEAKLVRSEVKDLRRLESERKTK